MVAGDCSTHASRKPECPLKFSDLATHESDTSTHDQADCCPGMRWDFPEVVSPTMPHQELPRQTRVSDRAFVAPDWPTRWMLRPAPSSPRGSPFYLYDEETILSVFSHDVGTVRISVRADGGAHVHKRILRTSTLGRVGCVAASLFHRQYQRGLSAALGENARRAIVLR